MMITARIGNSKFFLLGFLDFADMRAKNEMICQKYRILNAYQNKRLLNKRQDSKKAARNEQLYLRSGRENLVVSHFIINIHNCQNIRRLPL
jgi:hypothetical protein